MDAAVSAQVPHHEVSCRADFGIPAHVNAKFYWMRVAAEKRGIDFQLTKEELHSLLQGVPERCPCCKFPYVFTKGKRYPSIDRVDADGPYAMYNVRVICAKCNSTKGGVERGTIRQNSVDVRRVRAWIHDTWVTDCINASFL
jgi:hypothetical protein